MVHSKTLRWKLFFMALSLATAAAILLKTLGDSNEGAAMVAVAMAAGSTLVMVLALCVQSQKSKH